MIKEDIRIKHLIVHILDPTIGMPVLSDTELEYGSTTPGNAAFMSGSLRFTKSFPPTRMKTSSK